MSSLSEDVATDFITYLVSYVPTIDAYPILALNYARKLYFERDYEAIYDYLLHEERKPQKQEFIKQEAQRFPCETGELSAIHLQQEVPYWNTMHVMAPAGNFIGHYKSHLIESK